MVAALAVALVLSVIEANRVEHETVPTQSTYPGRPWNDLGRRSDDRALTPVVAAGMQQTQTDPDAWGYVARVNVVGDIVVIHVRPSTSKAMAVRVCEQARRYLVSPDTYSPKLRDLIVVSPAYGVGPDEHTGCGVLLRQ